MAGEITELVRRVADALGLTRRTVLQVLERAELEARPRSSAVMMVAEDGRSVWCATRVADAAILPGRVECACGKAEPGETDRACAARELREETGIRAAPSRLQLRGYIQTRDGRRLALYALRLAGDERPRDTEPTKRGPWELRGAGSFAGMGRPLAPGFAVMLAMLLTDSL